MYNNALFILLVGQMLMNFFSNNFKNTCLLFLAGTSLYLPIFYFGTESLQAQNSYQAMVLPFQVEGKKDAIYKFSPQSSFDLQSATHFLWSQHVEYPLISLAKTTDILSELNFNSQKKFHRRRAQQLCRRAQVSYLVTGHAYIYDKHTLLLKMYRFYCRNNNLATSPQIRIRQRAKLQSKMLQLIRNLSSFARHKAPLASYPLLQNSNRPKSDLVLLLDYSGSMRYDLKTIFAKLHFLPHQLNVETRMGVIQVLAGDKIKTLALNHDFSNIIRHLKREHIKGQVSDLGIKKAFDIIDRYNKWQGKKLIMLLSDAKLTPKYHNQLQSQLQNLRQREHQFCFFPVREQEKNTQNFWRKLALKSQAFYMDGLAYSRQVQLLKAGTLFFIRHNANFFWSQQKPRLNSNQNNSPTSSSNWQSLAINLYNTTQYNLQSLPQSFAKRKQDKILRFGPYTSNLESQIEKCLEKNQLLQTASLSSNNIAQNYIKVLVRSGAHAFWIHIQHNGLVTKSLSKYKNKELYLGLHWQQGQGNQRLQNLREPIYIRSKVQVPQLFVWKWIDLQKLSLQLLQKEDIWFIPAKFLKTKDGFQQNELRQ